MDEWSERQLAIMACIEEGGFLSYTTANIPESRYDEWYEYLLNNCNASYFKPATMVYYTNSGVSVVFYLLCVVLLVWNMVKNKERRYYPFIILMFLLETLNIVTKNIYQKFGLPIFYGFEMDRGRWVRGWYKDYEPSAKVLMEEIMLGANLAQQILLLSVNIVSILIMYHKPFWFMYPIVAIIYAPLQYGYHYIRQFEGEDMAQFLGIHPFFPPLFSIITWLGCFSLGKFAKFTLFPILRNEWRNRRFLKMMSTTSIIAVLTAIEVYPEALATVIYATTYKIVQYHVTTITGWFGKPIWYWESASAILYSLHALILVFEVSKYFSGFKILCVIRFLADEEIVKSESVKPLVDQGSNQQQSEETSNRSGSQ